MFGNYSLKMQLFNFKTEGKKAREQKPVYTSPSMWRVGGDNEAFRIDFARPLARAEFFGVFLGVLIEKQPLKRTRGRSECSPLASI